jgi:hypothetical protein
LRLCPQPAVITAAIDRAPIHSARRGRTATEAGFSRAIIILLARFHSRPTSQIGSQSRWYCKRDAECTIDLSTMIERYSWLSTQVYTPFDRSAEFARLFFGFTQVKSPCFRKVVCQKFQTSRNICTFVYNATHWYVQKIYRTGAIGKV